MLATTRLCLRFASIRFCVTCPRPLYVFVHELYEYIFRSGYQSHSGQDTNLIQSMREDIGNDGTKEMCRQNWNRKLNLMNGHALLIRLNWHSVSAPQNVFVCLRAEGAGETPVTEQTLYSSDCYQNIELNLFAMCLLFLATTEKEHHL